MTIKNLSDAALAAEKARLETLLKRKRHAPANYTEQLANVNDEIARREQDGSPDVDDTVTIETF
ncbi:MAG: hypothetical protein QNJ14_04260 [Woeseiaceae bacterium]|nr:hypothetical protein [Woeseiaceae bacterium]